MSTASLLATVAAAAHDPHASALTAEPAGNSTEEIEMANPNGPAVPAALTSVVALIAAHPELCAELQATARVEGATAERARILGIEANALPGHDALVAEMKADGNVTPDQAAGRILAAERKLRGDAAQAIKDVENTTGAVKPAAVAAGHQPAAETANTVEGWKAEWAKSDALKAEFETAEQYATFKEAESNGRVRILKTQRA